MGFLYLVSLSFVASIVLIDRHLRSEFTKDDFQRTISTGMPVSRFLRSNNAADNKPSEERAGGISVSALEMVKSVFTSSKAARAKVQSWLKSGKPADAVFIRLHHHGSENPFYKPQFVDWINYADELSASAKAPEIYAISILTRRYGDDDLFYMIKSA
ncbi:RxLR effector protein [Phytophthora megakarya]|uniref:RxLR effector protein n=1 Tax=Phytophthora megakarya TaxID=4795 RepID=A0A225UJZ6_9STRA|nr:RxLR effector protein [Phytophthora megakarya]